MVKENLSLKQHKIKKEKKMDHLLIGGGGGGEGDKVLRETSFIYHLKVKKEKERERLSTYAFLKFQ